MLCFSCYSGRFWLSISVFHNPYNSPDPGGQGTFYGSLWFSLFALVKAYLQLMFRESLEKKNQKSNFCFIDLLSYLNSVVSQINLSWWNH